MRPQSHRIDSRRQLGRVATVRNPGRVRPHIGRRSLPRQSGRRRARVDRAWRKLAHVGLAHLQRGHVPRRLAPTPTNASKIPEMAHLYQVATANYQRLITTMSDSGYPPVVGGDWNHPLDATRESWSPVPSLKAVGLTTNWMFGRPCQATRVGGAIDGFGFKPSVPGHRPRMPCIGPVRPSTSLGDLPPGLEGDVDFRVGQAVLRSATGPNSSACKEWGCPSRKAGRPGHSGRVCLRHARRQ